MIPGSQYAFAGLMICCNVVASMCIGIIVGFVVFAFGFRSDEYHTEDPSDIYKEFTYIVAFIVMVIVFYALSPVMIACIKWGFSP